LLPCPLFLDSQPSRLFLGPLLRLLRLLGLSSLPCRLFRLLYRSLAFLGQPRFPSLLLKALALKLRLLMRRIHLG